MMGVMNCVLLGALSLTPLPQELPRQDSQAPQTSVSALIRQLGDASYTVRQNAEKKLEELGSGALEALKQAAEKSESPEVRARARHLVERLESKSGPQEHSPQWFGRRGQDEDLRHMFDSLFERLERDFGLDIPRHSFFGDEFFGDLREQMRAMRERWNSLTPRHGEAISRSSSFRLNVDSSGVTLEIEEKNEDGDIEKKTYTAPDMESFREKYPELAQQYLDQRDGHFEFRFDPRRFFGEWPRFPGALDLSPMAPALPRDPRSGQPSGPVLGILARGVTPDLTAYLGLNPGEGLFVDTVQQGSLAERLGIQRRDVLVAIDGRPVGNPRDVRAALLDASGTVRVTVVRKGERLELSAPAPESKGKKAIPVRGLRKV